MTPGKEWSRLTDKQTAMLVLIGFCISLSVLFFTLSVLTAVHEAIRVRAGEGDSWYAAPILIVINPAAIALMACGALRAWWEFRIPEQNAAGVGENVNGQSQGLEGMTRPSN